MKLTAKNTYVLLLVTACLAVILVVVGAYIGDGILQKKSNDIRQQRLKTMVLQQQQAQFRKAQADIKTYQQLSSIARSIVPQDKDQAQTVREISTLASQNGVTLGAITFPTSSLGTTANALNSQLVPVKNIPGVYQLDITVKSDGKVSSPFQSFVNFLSALEHNRRTALVTGIDLQPDNENANNLFFSLTVEEYIKP